MDETVIYRIKVVGISASAAAAIIGAGAAWSANGGWTPASKTFVMAQYKALDDKAEKIYQFQRADRIERLEETIDTLDTRILETRAKLNDAKDDQTKRLINDLLYELNKKKNALDSKLGTLKVERQLQP